MQVHASNSSAELHDVSVAEGTQHHESHDYTNWILKAANDTGCRSTGFAVFTKVLKTLQDIRSGKLTIFTRPGTSLPDRKKYRIITQNQSFNNLSILFIVKQQYYSDI